MAFCSLLAGGSLYGLRAAQAHGQLRPVRPNAPPRDRLRTRSITFSKEGSLYKFRGHVELETTDMMLRADEVDYDEDSGQAEARGHVYFQHFARNEELRADRAAYNLNDDSGKFYKVQGSASPHVESRPHILISTNPFYFQGEWAEKIENKYILYNGFITDCKIPHPWWVLSGPRFDIIPGERAIAHNTVFRLRKIPLFYTPYFYKSLEREPRRSGFLTPNIGNSSRRGKLIGISYYWAINRSSDLTYRFQDFTARGFAHHVEFRGKPRAGTDFDAIVYGVQDRMEQGGYSLYVTGLSDLGHGFTARGTLNYLSDLTFRQIFTETFTEAIFAEVNSVGAISKHWSSFNFHTAFARLQNFQSAQAGDWIVIRKLPQFELSSRDRQISERVLPLWFSFDSSAGLLRRSQPLFQTRQFMERADFQPRIMTAIRWKGFQLLPSFSARGTHYGERQEQGRITGQNLNRGSREVFVDFIMPSLERTFNRKTWLGEKLKHVIEPRASFRHVAGVLDFDKLIRFDETELLSNTTEAELSITNRLYAKRDGATPEILSWQLWQRRYFDPEFGGALLDGRRNVLLSSVGLTPYSFLDRPRNYSPVVSAFRATPKPGFSLEWRSDYDPLPGRFVNSSVLADVRVSKYFVSIGHSQVKSDPVLSPSANQFRGMLGFGNENRRGWNAAFVAIYDYRVGKMQYATTQVTYNTDCCGFSVQYRRLSFGLRNENQFRVAFSVANIGSFGTLKKQERLF